ncbi:MAG: exodeoxyribonuclease VII large subunit [Zetaproteobacteria bacterium CG2_30_46_52]|nr:MAG: exodeoxyribonuclease VII large subunit [Zetaproteobacteria bacterium CG2_30_46_52]
MISAPLTVTELTARIKQVLEQGFAQIEVTGEISRLTKPSSGHIYFTIKDNHAAISAVVWRTTAVRLNTRPQEGQAYVFFGHLSLYEPRGTYQIVVQHIEPVGAGQLAAEFERRKQLFASRGWFEQSHKLPIPALPQHIGIVTSATSAAYEDVKKVLATRPNWLHITVAPAVVQGEQAAQSVVSAIQQLHKLEHKPDVILLVRGGGSIEDLWCFNDERIVQAIFEASIPIISGVGHEIDTTLVDLVADVRAATPSNAAELACPDRLSLSKQLPSLVSLASLIQRRIQHWQQQNNHLFSRQSHAMQRLQDNQHWTVERLSHQYQHLVRAQTQQQRLRIRDLKTRLQYYEPHQRLRHDTATLIARKQHLFAALAPSLQTQRKHIRLPNQRLATSMQLRFQTHKQHWLALHEHLLALNPKQVLKRGYAMTTSSNGSIVSSAQSLQKGDSLILHYADGSVLSEVKQTHLDANKDNHAKF